MRGAAAASGWGHIKFGGCRRRGGGAAGEALGTGAEPKELYFKLTEIKIYCSYSDLLMAKRIYTPKSPLNY